MYYCLISYIRVPPPLCGFIDIKRSDTDALKEPWALLLLLLDLSFLSAEIYWFPTVSLAAAYRLHTTRFQDWRTSESIGQEERGQRHSLRACEQWVRFRSKFASVIAQEVSILRRRRAVCLSGKEDGGAGRAKAL